MADPNSYGRRPDEGPAVSRETIDSRQAAALRQTENAMLPRTDWKTPAESGGKA